MTRPELHPQCVDAGPLTIEIGPSAETCLITLRGELDLGGVPALEHEVDRLFSAQLQRIVIDLAALEFIDSCGVQCLLLLSRRSSEDGDRLRFIGPRGDVDRLLRLMGVREVLPVLEP